MHTIVQIAKQKDRLPAAKLQHQYLQVINHAGIINVLRHANTQTARYQSSDGMRRYLQFTDVSDLKPEAQLVHAIYILREIAQTSARIEENKGSTSDAAYLDDLFRFSLTVHGLLKDTVSQNENAEDIDTETPSLLKKNQNRAKSTIVELATVLLPAYERAVNVQKKETEATVTKLLDHMMPEIIKAPPRGPLMEKYGVSLKHRNAARAIKRRFYDTP